MILYDLDNRRITAEAEAGERNDSVTFSPDGSLLATTCSFQGGAHVRIDRVTADGGLEHVTEIERAARDTIPAAVFAPDGRYLVIWETSGTDNERRAPGWRGDLLLCDTGGAVIWQRAITSETRTSPAPNGWYTRPCITPDGGRIVLGLDGTVVLLRTNDGTQLAVVPVDGRVTTAAAASGALIVATDQGLREIEPKRGRGLRRFLRRSLLHP